MIDRLDDRRARTVTLSVTGLLLVVLVAVLIVMPVPYVRVSPGPATDTLGEVDGKPLITIEGRQTYPDTGKLELTTVAVSNKDHRMSLLEAMSGWARSGVAVVPKETVYPDEDATAEEIEQRNTQEMALSQKHATAAALKALKIPIQQFSVVAELTEGTPAFGKLQIADRILQIDGKPIASPQDVVTLVQKHKPGEQVRFVVERAGERRTVAVVTGKHPEDAKLPFVGITPDRDYQFPFSVTIKLDDVGGPSAGLMFALGIVERLTPEEITGGQTVAGTGSITDEGEVGQIGGIAMKILGAQRTGATVFMVPADNCREATLDPPDGIKLVKVDTLATALSALEAIRTGTGSVPTC